MCVLNHQALLPVQEINVHVYAANKPDTPAIRPNWEWSPGHAGNCCHV